LGAAIVSLLAGLGAIAVGLWLGYQEMVRPHAEGEVIRNEYIKGANYAPTVRYDVEGQTYQVHGRMSPRRPAYRVGERVTVWYPPGRPAEGRLRGFFEVWGKALALGAVGVLLALAGLWALTSRSRRTLPRFSKSRDNMFHGHGERRSS
jgi:hypothetical protein